MLVALTNYVFHEYICDLSWFTFTFINYYLLPTKNSTINKICGVGVGNHTRTRSRVTIKETDLIVRKKIIIKDCALLRDKGREYDYKLENVCNRERVSERKYYEL
jgi:hypothetical protein